MTGALLLASPAAALGAGSIANGGATAGGAHRNGASAAFPIPASARPQGAAKTPNGALGVGGSTAGTAASRAAAAHTSAPGATPSAGAPTATAPANTAAAPANTATATTPAPPAGSPQRILPSTATPGRNGILAGPRSAAGGRLSTDALVAVAIAALLVALSGAWALGRWMGVQPTWTRSLTYSLEEASFRASATWAELLDWARLGR